MQIWLYTKAIVNEHQQPEAFELTVSAESPPVAYKVDSAGKWSQKNPMISEYLTYYLICESDVKKQMCNDFLSTCLGVKFLSSFAAEPKWLMYRKPAQIIISNQKQL